MPVIFEPLLQSQASSIQSSNRPFASQQACINDQSPSQSVPPILFRISKFWGIDEHTITLTGLYKLTTCCFLLTVILLPFLRGDHNHKAIGVIQYRRISLDLRREYLRIAFVLHWKPFVAVMDLESLRKSKRFSDTGLVTKTENGIVVSYKVVWMLTPDVSSDKLDFMIYSSDSGIWEKTQNVRCLHSTNWARQDKSIALNGILHWLSDDKLCFDASSIVACDFYGDDNDDGCCSSIHFPGSEVDEVTQHGRDDELRRFRRNFTTSEGSIVYFNEFYENDEDGETRTFRVWRLVKYTDVVPDAWELSWEINLESSLIGELGSDYFPVVMHPLNSEIIYLWSRNQKGLVLFNLRTHVFTLRKETEEEDGKCCMDGCILSFNGCSEYMEDIRRYYLPWYQGCPNDLFFSQYVLPRWLHRLPRPRLLLLCSRLQNR
ncbi:unnamed protein product [Thlaspi arvense]|uniref:F-box protein At3g26010-like beta-propeller domain-containing protein n=1 Tax=Thlaspi arvense TaxID=13288 RepID=A0AAU9RWJ4_THLAR|nr:unnamed protein product [Thlaspi arvense]